MSKLIFIREKIRQILSEMSVLNELQRIPSLNDDINKLFQNVVFYIDGVKITSTIAPAELKAECISELRLALLNLESSKFNFSDFYIIKFSDFYVKGTPTYEKLTFSDVETNKMELFTSYSTSFAVYIFQDKIIKIFPYNDNFHSDSVLEKEARRFIDSKQFSDMFDTPKQKIKFDGNVIVRTFGTKFKIFTKYFTTVYGKKDSTEKTEKKPYAQPKKVYKVGRPLMHNKFGKGTIKSVRKAKDKEGFYLDVIFPEIGNKTIFMT